MIVKVSDTPMFEVAAGTIHWGVDVVLLFSSFFNGKAYTEKQWKK